MYKKYANERDFSRALCKTLRDRGCFTQRIESGLTGRGIPDIYTIVNEQAFWLELKRVKHFVRDFEGIPWREGQQAWLQKVTELKQRAYTVACFNDKIAMIPHDKHYDDNIVIIKDNITCLDSLDDVVNFLKVN